MDVHSNILISQDLRWLNLCESDVWGHAQVSSQFGFNGTITMSTNQCPCIIEAHSRWLHSLSISIYGGTNNLWRFSLIDQEIYIGPHDARPFIS
jgi:hypothetical protein